MQPLRSGAACRQIQTLVWAAWAVCLCTTARSPPSRFFGCLQHNVRDWLRVIASNKDRSGEN